MIKVYNGCIDVYRHQADLRLKRRPSEPSAARCGSERETAHGRWPSQFKSLCLRHCNYSVTTLLGNGLAVSRILLSACFVSCFALIHSHTSLFLFSLLFTVHPSCIFPIRPSIPIIYSNHYCISRSLLLSKRLHHPFRGLRNATPRRALASLRCDTLSLGALAYPLLGLPLLQAGRPRSHTPTAYAHSLIHSFIHISPLRQPWRPTQSHRNPPDRRIRLRATSDQVPRTRLQRTKKRAVSSNIHSTLRHVITQHHETHLNTTQHGISRSAAQHGAHAYDHDDAQSRGHDLRRLHFRRRVRIAALGRRGIRFRQLGHGARRRVARRQ
jgi:hypothetical protein